MLYLDKVKAFPRGITTLEQIVPCSLIGGQMQCSSPLTQGNDGPYDTLGKGYNLLELIGYRLFPTTFRFTRRDCGHGSNATVAHPCLNDSS